MRISKILLIGVFIVAGISVSNANTVVFSEDFNEDYHENFPTILELDHNMPASNVSPIFQNDQGVAMPWWHVKDSSTSSDRFLASHSIYVPAGKSNDWASSRAIEIPTEGFNLRFGAQSLRFRSNPESSWVSSLWVFITENAISAENLPTEPALFIEEVPFGNKIDDCEGDFVKYTINLDQYAGKTIYISFANLNEDKDFLLIDDVIVEREDPASLSIAADPLQLFGDSNIEANIMANEDLHNWSIEVSDIYGHTYSESGESISAGETHVFSLPVKIYSDITMAYTVTFKSDENLPLVQKTNISGLTFMPWKNVLVEETTGMWCGNCPQGAYNMESMAEHEETKDYAVGVSVHISGSNDYLVDETYAGLFGTTIAPAYRVDRDTRLRLFSGSLDKEFNPDIEGSMGNLIRTLHNEPTTLEVSLDAEYVYENGEAKKIALTATVLPALSVDASNYRIGFIMKENNVYGGNSLLMIQENYFAGQAETLGSTYGGWTELSKKVIGCKWHDVARGIWNFRGIENSLPSKIVANEPTTFSYTIDIPDTYYAIADSNGNMHIGNPAIVPDNIVMIAFVYDTANSHILNCVQMPMSDKALIRDSGFLSSVESLPFEDVNEADAPAVYYDLQGRRVVNPGHGLYIERRGRSTYKVVK